MCYLGLSIGALIGIRELRGREALALLMLTIIVSDTAQFYSGRLFGRHLLAPIISPKKTVEGLVAAHYTVRAPGPCRRGDRRARDRRRSFRVDVEAERRRQGQLNADSWTWWRPRSHRRTAVRGAGVLRRPEVGVGTS